MKNLQRLSLLLLVSIWMFSSAAVSQAQLRSGAPNPPVSRTGGFSIYGDLQVSGSEAENRLLTFDVMLALRTGVIIER